jgi:hypothetical protein
VSDEPFLSRWSRRKRGVARGSQPPTASASSASAPPEAKAIPFGSRADPVPHDLASDAMRVPALVDPSAPAPGAEAPGGEAPASEADPSARPLPHPSTLTPSSDFTPFMRPSVAPEQRNAALKRLFTDPHFNRMDGLDVYIDDYSKPDPLPAAVVAALRHAVGLGLGEPDPAREAPPEDVRRGEPAAERAPPAPPASPASPASPARTCAAGATGGVDSDAGDAVHPRGQQPGDAR